MTLDKIIFEYRATGMSDAYLQAMAVAYALGAAHEREACARIVDAAQPFGYIAATAAAIRARGEQ